MIQGVRKETATCTYEAQYNDLQNNERITPWRCHEHTNELLCEFHDTSKSWKSLQPFEAATRNLLKLESEYVELSRHHIANRPKEKIPNKESMA